MKAHKKIQILQIAGKNLSATPGDSIIVETKNITSGQRKWDGELVSIRDLRGGKSQVVRLR